MDAPEPCKNPTAGTRVHSGGFTRVVRLGPGVAENPASRVLWMMEDPVGVPASGHRV